MSLDKAMKNLKFDARMIEFNLRTGTLTKEELQKHLSQLPDSANNSAKLDLDDESNGEDTSLESH